MKWLLITDDEKFFDSANDFLTLQDKKNKLILTDFELTDIKKYIKNCDDFAACFIFKKNDSDAYEFSEKKVSLSLVIGYFASRKIPIFTDLKFLAENEVFTSTLEKDIFISKENDELDFLAKLKKNYKKITENAVKRIAKNKLLDRGIPFTSDCFATYIAKNKIEVVNEFLEAGMSINEKDDAGVPMLNIACRTDNFDFVKLFLELGANLDAVSEDRGYTAVMDAVWRGNEKITKYLIERGADLNTINKEGQTNLILAVGANRENIVKLLAENGSNPDVKDTMGMSAYTYAVLFKKSKIVELLKPFHKE